ncbi:EAL domain-containing protein [Niallia oryzisoli]|uniref:sensor domain-containing protein n=1 Tax=Niallia oryzisoli TaxID=1737571 RepID=UPI0037369ABA
MDYEVELNKALQRLSDIELALNESSIVAITDNKGIIQFANDKFCKLSKYSKKELVGSNQNIVKSGYHDHEFFKELWRTIGRGEIWKGEIKNRAKDGTYYWVDTTIVPFLNEKKKPYQYISIRHDITVRKEYEEEVKKMAYYDSLTSLPNRNMLDKWVNSRLIENNSFTVLFLDLDHFKSINDNYGHHNGDLVLKEAATRLKNCLRKSDFITRQGGDEFIIILNGVFEKNDILNIVEKINYQLNLPFQVNMKKITTSASIGISREKIIRIESIQYSIEKLIKQADTAMYHAKDQGGNTYCFNTPNQNSELERYYQLDQEIVNGLDKKQFFIVYQPLIQLNSNKIVGVEALLRWNHPTLGSISPIEFIPMLEEKGLIIPVGRWVLKSVCEQLNNWHREGIELERVSINVSPVQFRNENFVDDFREILQENQIKPNLLEIEITEGILINIDRAAKIIDDLKELGVKIAIDDFGTGYSSLNYLKRLPINTIKIDKSFIHDLDFDNEIIVNTIIYLGKQLNFTVLAEGIENSEQLSYLQGQNCNEGQGYLWSQPVTGDEIQRIYYSTLQKR